MIYSNYMRNKIYRSKKEEIISDGNLIPYPYMYNNNKFTSKTVNGITYTDNGDKSITINGTATASANLAFSNEAYSNIDKTKKYVISLAGDEINKSAIRLLLQLFNNSTWIKNFQTPWSATIDFSTITDEFNMIVMMLVVDSGTKADNISVIPQLKLYEE